jgi:hypothetical protein
VQASLAANTFAVTGHAENKREQFRHKTLQIHLLLPQRSPRCCLGS